MALDVELIGEEDIKVKGGIEKKRKGYKKYSDAVDRINLVAWIKGEIEKKPERMIVVKIDDVAKEMGPEFVNVGYQIMYQALKAILFRHGIFLSMATHKDGDKTFLLREVKKGDQLAPSYLFVKHRIKQEEIPEIEEQAVDEMKEKEEDKEEKKEVKEIKRIIKEKLAKKEEEKQEKERQEGITMREEIRKLKEILHGRLGRKSCMVEIFQFNWDTLTWRMIKRSSVRTHLKLLEVVMENISTKENRYRIEFTPLHQLENMEKEVLEDEDSGEQENKVDNAEGQVKESIKGEVKGEEKGDIHGIEATDLTEVSDTLEELRSKEEKVGKVGKVGDVEGAEKVEPIQEIKEGEMVCPRCEGKNIKTWPTVQIIKTRSGDRKLRHRCVDCNETFSDEDLGISEQFEK